MLQHLGDAVALDGDDALISLLAAAGHDRDHETPRAEQLGHIALGKITLPLGSGAQRMLAGRLDHQQLHRSVALHLHDQRAFELEYGREQSGRRHHVAQQRLQRGGVAAGVRAPRARWHPGARSRRAPACSPARTFAGNRSSLSIEPVAFILITGATPFPDHFPGSAGLPVWERDPDAGRALIPGRWIPARPADPGK